MPKSAADSLEIDQKYADNTQKNDIKVTDSHYDSAVLYQIAELMADEIAQNPEADPRRLPMIASTASRLQLLYHAAIVLQHHLDREEEAFQLLEYALLENPANSKTLERLESLARSTGNFERLCTVATHAMETMSSPQNKAQLCLQIGDWCLTELERGDHAALYYQKALEIDIDSIPALGRLIDLYRENEQWEDLAIALAAAADKSQDPTEKVQLFLEAAQLLHTQIGNMASAAACYGQAIEVDENCQEAWDSLQQIYRNENRWWECIALIKRRLETTLNLQQKIRLYLEIAQLQLDFAEDPEKAETEYRTVLELDPSNISALTSLEKIYADSGKTDQMKQIIARQIPLANSSSEKAELLQRLVHNLEESEAESAIIVSAWEDILRIDPSHTTALEHLSAFYESEKEWDNLIRILGHCIDSAPDNQATGGAFLRLAQIFGTELGDNKIAKKYYKQALSKNPHSIPALEGLADVYCAAHSWKSANKTLKMLVQLSDEPSKKIDYLVQIGDILAKQLKKPGPAAQYYEQALSHDREHLPALEALRSVCIKLEDWKKAIQILTWEIDLASSEKVQSTLMAKMGEFYQNLSLIDDAIACYEQATKIDPKNKEAQLSLLPLMIEDGRLEELEPLISASVDKRVDYTDAEKYYLCVNLAMVRQKIGLEKQSLTPARTATRLDPSSTAALAVYAKALIANKRWQEAHDAYQELVGAHSREISHDDLLQFIYLLGDLSARLDLTPQAIDYFERLLREQASHLGALTKLIELYEKENNFSQSWSCRLRLTDLLNGREKSKNYMGLGDICIEHRGNVKEAMGYYLRALEITPDDRAILHKLIPIYSENHEWDKLIRTLYEIANLEEDPAKRARFYYSIAVIHRDKLEDPEAAHDCFTQALKENYNDKTSFDALVEMLKSHEDYKTLERCLRQMIFRCHEAGQGESKRALQLWHTLGELYRVELGDYKAAALAHQRIAQADPHDLKHRELAAACIFQVPEKSDKAIEEYRDLIARDPDNADYYQPLGNLLNSLGRYDEAWCVAGALQLMGKANSKEKKFYSAFADPTPTLLKAAMDKQMMQRLRHPDDGEQISEIFAIVLPVLLSKSAENLRTYGVTKSNAKYKRRNRLMLDLFNYAADCLKLPEIPRLYLKKKDQSPLTYMRTDPPQSLCGELYPKERSEKELLFMVVNHLAYYRPGCLLPRLMPSDIELKSLLTAAGKLGNPVFQHPRGATAIVSRQTTALAQLLSEIQKSDLQDAANLFIATNAPLSIRKWRAGIEYTAARAAMLLTGDLIVSASTVRKAGSQLGQLSISKKIADLKAFSVSQEYAELRQALGICIDEKRVPKIS